MTIICPVCHTENRDIAKFCIECVTTLPTRAGSLDYIPTELAETPASRRKRRGVLSAPLLIVAVAGWVIAAAGGWYIYSSLRAEAPTPSAVPAMPVAAMPSQPAPAAAPIDARPVAGPVGLQSVQPKDAEAGKAAAAPIATVESAKRPPAPLAAPAGAVSLSAPAPAPATVKKAELPAAARSSGPAAAAPGPAAPDAACAGLNFVAAARCMAAQCVKPEFAPHAQCEAVRRQQRLEEEKRNPTMAN